MTIRQFEAQEAEAVSRLIIDNLLQINVNDYDEPTVRQLARFYTPEFVLDYARAGEMIVALEGQDLVGTATLQQERVRNVFVKAGWHGQGIGRRLMCCIEDSARRQALPRLALRANVGAVDFYQRLGFTSVGVKEERVGEARLKTVLMEKAL
jgi:GNAT superfamily N-acetyltransferase